MASEKAAAEFQLEKELKRTQEAQVGYNGLFPLIDDSYLYLESL